MEFHQSVGDRLKAPIGVVAFTEDSTTIALFSGEPVPPVPNVGDTVSFATTNTSLDVIDETDDSYFVESIDWSYVVVSLNEEAEEDENSDGLIVQVTVNVEPA